MKQHWNKTFSETPHVYGQEANQFIQEISKKIPIVNNTLAIAEGEGRNILYLAEQAKQRGEPFIAEMWDFSVEGINNALSRAYEREIALIAKVNDLGEATWPQAFYDNIVCVFGHFPVAVQEKILNGVRESLKPNGWLFCEVYSKKQIDYGTGGPKNIEMLYDPKLFLDVFGNDHIFHFFVGEVTRHEGSLHNGVSHVIQCAIQIKK